MKTFSWLHLTDFHQGMNEQSWLWPNVKDRFFEDLEKLHDKNGPWDLVLFTGDLTQRGSAEEFQKLDEVLEKLWEKFKRLGSSPKLLAVPGNHDLVRPNEKDPSVKLLRLWNDDPDVQSEFWEDANSPYRKVVTEAFKNYTYWLKNQPFKADNLNDGILPGDFSVTIEKDDAKLGIVGFNSTFLQLTGDDYKGKLALHTRQFHAACGGDGPDWAKEHHACLLLTHQPPSWLNDNSQQNHLNGGITDAGRFAAHLCGHMHDTVYRNISEGGAEPKRIWQGRSLFGLEYIGKAEENIQRLHGYTAGKIELNEEKGRLIFWPRGETCLQGGQREIVSDQSVKLIDEYHTIPREFNLLNSQRIPDNNDKVPGAVQGNILVNIDFHQKIVLRDLLLECPSFIDGNNRQFLVKNLPFANAIQYSNDPNFHVMNIIDACMSYHDNGFKHLLDILRPFDGDTKQFKNLIKFVK
jgi:3',5'-cyclic AMP phosphodiesterase CpdA